MVCFWSDVSDKTLTFQKGVVDKMAIFLTPHTPQYLFLLFLIFSLFINNSVFSEDFYYDSLEYKKLKLNDLNFYAGFLPEISYNIFENSFSLQISLNKIISNSLSLYENQIEKELFKKNYSEKKTNKIESVNKLLLSEKKNYEKNVKIITSELDFILQEITSLNNLIVHKEILLVLNKEIYNYHKNQFDAGQLTTIEFLKFKRDYLDTEYNYQELLYNREVLQHAEKSKRSEIPDS